MKIIVFSILLLSTGCSFLSAGEPTKNEKDDYYAIFSSFLGINEDRFTYIDNEGKSHSDQLKLFKELEGIYIRHIKPRKNDTYSREQAKIIMFFAFYAKNRGSGAFSEYLASDLNPIYSKNRLLFLELMGELPFLIPSVCDRLNAFFGFEGNNVSGKESFVRDNKTEFEKYLSKKQAETCLAQFSK